MKYVMLEAVTGDVKKRIPIIFPDFMCHVDIAEAMKTILNSQHKLPSQVFSAGDIKISVDWCGGMSSTLNTSSRGEIDEQVIDFYDYGHGIVCD